MSAHLFRRLAALLVALSFYFSGAGITSAAVVTLKVHHFLPTTSVTHAKLLVPWAERVERESQGRIKVRIFPAMQLGGKANQLYDQARDGVADVVWTLPGYTAGRFPIMEAFELPFMISTAEATSQAAWEFYVRHARDEFKDVHPILVHVHEAGAFHMREIRIRSLDDMKGVKVRAPTRVINEALKALGAVPVGMPVPQVPQALAKGVVDGAVIPFEVAYPLRVPELVKHHTLLGGDRGLYTTVFMMAMNKKRYDSLGPELRKVIDESGGLALAGQIGRVWDEAAGPGKKMALDRGNTIDVLGPDEAARWKAATRPVIDAWIADMDARGLNGRALYDDALALVEKYTAKASQ